LTATILLTGFGPFPGAPFNPTGPLVRELARQNSFGLRRVAHVFTTSYQTVDRELPALIARERPDALIMFGLAGRSHHIRIETRARNALTARVADADGHLPSGRVIVPGEPAALRLAVPAPRLVTAVRAAGLSAALSRDAGDYLCNYLCWRASEAAEQNGGPRLVAFAHVPNVHRSGVRGRRGLRLRQRPPAALADLVVAGEAILCAVRVMLTD
jgi:pyroglutamyl-peptidase